MKLYPNIYLTPYPYTPIDLFTPYVFIPIKNNNIRISASIIGFIGFMNGAIQACVSPYKNRVLNNMPYIAVLILATPIVHGVIFGAYESKGKSYDKFLSSEFLFREGRCGFFGTDKPSEGRCI